MDNVVNSKIYSVDEIKEFAGKVLLYTYNLDKLIEASNISKFRSRIIEYRKFRNLQSSKLAERIGLSKQRMSQLENGRIRHINKCILENMKVIENCEPEYLLGFTDRYDKKLSKAKRYCYEKNCIDKYSEMIKYVENNYDNIELDINFKKVFKVYFNPSEAINDDFETLKNEFFKYAYNDTELLRYFNAISKLSSKNKDIIKEIIADTLKLIDKYPIYTV